MGWRGVREARTSAQSPNPHTPTVATSHAGHILGVDGTAVMNIITGVVSSVVLAGVTIVGGGTSKEAAVCGRGTAVHGCFHRLQRRVQPSLHLRHVVVVEAGRSDIRRIIKLEPTVLAVDVVVPAATARLTHAIAW